MRHSPPSMTRRRPIPVAPLTLAVVLGLAIVLAAATRPLVARVDAPEPLAPNPLVQALVDEVSPARLEADLTRIVGFHTRHTSSSTTSATIGIGAARFWMHQSFGSAAPRVEAGTFDFQATVCGERGPHRNVTARLPGAIAPERHIWVTAHLDSRTRDRCDARSFAPGANDDGSGTVLLLELARLLGREPMDSTVMLAAFTGEEQGLFGSTAQAAAAQGAGMRIDALINNDIVGSPEGCADPACPPGAERESDPDSVRHFADGPSTSRHRQVARAVKLNAERYVPGFTIALIAARDRPGRGGDHTPFAALGFPATRLTASYEDGDGSGRNGRQHNERDTLDGIDFAYLARITRANVAAVANLAMAPESPMTPTVTTVGGALHVTWPSLPDPSVAGYRVAVRDADPDALFYAAIRDAGLTGGMVQSLDVTGLPASIPVYLSVSAHDAEGNESVFSAEVRAVPPDSPSPSPPSPSPSLTPTTAPRVTMVPTRSATPLAPTTRTPSPTPQATLTARLFVPHALQIGDPILDAGSGSRASCWHQPAEVIADATARGRWRRRRACS